MLSLRGQRIFRPRKRRLTVVCLRVSRFGGTTSAPGVQERTRSEVRTGALPQAEVELVVELTQSLRGTVAGRFSPAIVVAET